MFHTKSSCLKKSFFLCVFIILLNLCHLKGELFTAIVDLEKLLNTERLLVQSLDVYLFGEERRLGQLREIREKLANIESVASQDVGSYLANPVNAFLLVKTLTTDWKNGNYPELVLAKFTYLSPYPLTLL